MQHQSRLFVQEAPEKWDGLTWFEGGILMNDIRTLLRSHVQHSSGFPPTRCNQTEEQNLGFLISQYLIFRIRWAFWWGHFQLNSSLSEWLQPMGLLFSVSLLELVLQVQTAHHNSIGKLHYCPHFFCWLIHVLSWWWWLYSQFWPPCVLTTWNNWMNQVL